MALTGEEHWTLGFVFADAAETELAHTEDGDGATWQQGFLRDPDGRLVTTTEDGAYDTGFLRDSGALVLDDDDESTPPLYSFAALEDETPAEGLAADTELEADTVLVAGGVQI